jgi:hypothetical protein
VITTKPGHGDTLIQGGKATQALQQFLDDLSLTLGQSVRLPSYTVSSLPKANKNTGGLVFVTDEVGGSVTAFSDGQNWRRTTDRGVVS